MTRMMGIAGKVLASGLACLLTAACSNAPTSRTASTTSGVSISANEIDTIMALLGKGKTRGAQKRISAGLKKSPGSPELMVLRDSITREPEKLLGPASFRYTVAPGDTMASLSERFLGNRLKFYQLSRYNGIDNPSTLRPGHMLNIPGRKAIQTPPAPQRRRAPTQPAQAAPTPRAGIAADPAAARQARSAGLAALNAGHPSQAVTLLKKAANLDPGNAAITRDLGRARRIAATVGAK